METEPPSNPQDLTAFVTDLLEQMRAARVREPAVTALGFPAPHAIDATRCRTRRPTTGTGNYWRGPARRARKQLTRKTHAQADALREHVEPDRRAH